MPRFLVDEDHAITNLTNITLLYLVIASISIHNDSLTSRSHFINSVLSVILLNYGDDNDFL